MMGYAFVDRLYGDGILDDFDALIFDLIVKADPINLRKISRAFPEHVRLYEWWMNQPLPPTETEVMKMAEEIQGKVLPF